MAKKYLIVIDMQNDFVTGSLGTREAQVVAPRVIQRVSLFDGTVIFTQDTHFQNYMNTQEGKQLPVKHCIQGTAGWRLIPELEAFQAENKSLVFEKPTFGSVELSQFLLEKFQKNEVESVELLGLCTDICVISNALLLKAYMPELPIFVDSSCCAGVSPNKHEAALDSMESCQIIVRREGTV